MHEVVNRVALALTAIGAAVVAEPEPLAPDTVRVVVHGGHHRITQEVIQDLVMAHRSHRIRISTAEALEKEARRERLLKGVRA